MNQLINLEKMTLEEIREIQLQLTQKEVALLSKNLERVDHEHKETKFEVKEQKAKLKETVEKTGYLEHNMIIHSKQAQQIGNLAKKKCIECLGGKDAPAYKELYPKMRANFWGYFKQVFQLVTHSGGGSYKDLRSRDFDLAKDWIKNYKPAAWLQKEIDLANLESEASHD